MHYGALQTMRWADCAPPSACTWIRTDLMYVRYCLCGRRSKRQGRAPKLSWSVRPWQRV